MSTPTLINIVLDQSGSMSSVRQATIDGLNEFIASQKDIEGDAFLTLTVFNTNSVTRYVGVPLEETALFGTFHNPYSPNGGTALFDAVGSSIKNIESWIRNTSFKGKVLNVILTDGQENSSYNWHINLPAREGDAFDVASLIAWKQEKDNWEFVFLGSGGSEWLEKTFGHVARPEAFFGYTHDMAHTHSTYGGLGSAVTASRTVGAVFDNASFVDYDVNASSAVSTSKVTQPEDEGESSETK